MIPYLPKEKNILKCVDILQFLVSFVPALCFLGGSNSKVSAYNVGDWVRSLGWKDSSGEGNGNPFQYSCLENPMDGGLW